MRMYYRGGRNGMREFLSNLRLALEIAPVEILTNGRRYIRNHLGVLEELHDRYPNRLTLRITIESPVESEHDAIRGRTTFVQTVETVRELGEMGFVPVITAERPLLHEDSPEAIRPLIRRPVSRHQDRSGSDRKHAGNGAPACETCR